MQLVLSNNRVIAHGENFLTMGSVVINTETGAKYENATVAECENCPSDIDTVGYEYHAGVFVPCAPFGMGNNNGFFMEVCESCATPRNSGIKIKGGIKLENLDLESVTALALGGAHATKLWENGSWGSDFSAQSVNLGSTTWTFLIVRTSGGSVITNGTGSIINVEHGDNVDIDTYWYRKISLSISGENKYLKFTACRGTRIYMSDTIEFAQDNGYLIPYEIYGVKL